jgi:DNA-binding winged helix-turn-helix (wHTH) protein
MSASEARIGPFILNRRLGRLEDGSNDPPHLRPKSYRVLEVLSERRGALVSKDDLISAVWTNVAVTDESLSQCISDIRRALGNDAAQLLRTVPRRGYVLDTEPLG